MKTQQLSCILRALSGLLLSCVLGNAQGRITFDHPGFPPGTGRLETYYSEGSMTFTPADPEQKFSRQGSGTSYFPDNGSTYVLQGYQTSISGTRGLRSPFRLYSVDLAEFSTIYNYPWSVTFIGYRGDGSMVKAEFNTDGIIDGTGPLPDFQTFYFDQSFDDLLRFDVPGYGFAMDNLQFYNATPEPTAVSIFFLSGASILFFRGTRK